MDEVDQVALTDAQKVSILPLLKQEDEAALHGRPVIVELSLLEDGEQLLKGQLLLLATYRPLDRVEQLGLHLGLLKLLAYDELHLLLLVGAEVDDLALYLLHHEEHDLHGLSRARLVNENAAGVLGQLALVIANGLAVLLVKEARKVQRSHLCHTQLLDRSFLSLAEGELGLRTVVTPVEEVLDRVVPNKVDLARVPQASQAFLYVRAVRIDFLG